MTTSMSLFNRFSLFASLIRTTHPNLKPILAFPKTTHPNLPKGKELVTLSINYSPHLASPEGEGQIQLTA